MEAITPELITALLGTGGLAYIVPKAIDGIKAWRSGRALEEKSKNKSLVARLAEAEAREAVAEERAESEATWRRQLEEYAAGLRVDLITLGVAVTSIRPWPKRKEEEPHA